MQTRILVSLLLCATQACVALGETQAETAKKERIPCGVVDAFGGEVRTLDSHQSRMQEAIVGMEVACDGWISVDKGWVRVKHRDGFKIQIGSDSFVRFSAVDSETADGGDQVVLYKGHLSALAGGGTGELRVITANGRARMNRGRLWVAYSKSSGESQLVTLENVATFENRFEPSSRITVKAGEVTSLNYKLLRVQPTPAQAVAVATLKPRLQDLHLDVPIQEAAFRLAIRRQNRKFASRLIDGDPEQAELDARYQKAKGGRNPASYTRHRNTSPDEEGKLHNHMVQHLVGGDKVGEQILYPDRYYGKAQRAQVIVEDPAKGLNDKLAKREREEKQRIIEELSKIRLD